MRTIHRLDEITFVGSLPVLQHSNSRLEISLEFVFKQIDAEHFGCVEQLPFSFGRQFLFFVLQPIDPRIDQTPACSTNSGGIGYRDNTESDR